MTMSFEQYKLLFHLNMVIDFVWNFLMQKLKKSASVRTLFPVADNDVIPLGDADWVSYEDEE